MIDLFDRTPLRYEDAPNIILFMGVMFIFFWFLYVCFAVYMGAQRENMHYHALSLKLKGDYLSRLVANAHAVIAVLMGYVLIFHGW